MSVEQIIKEVVSKSHQIYQKSTKGLRRGLRKATSRWRKLPDFIIIGAQKSGTSSLFYYLNQHPSLDLSTQKEIHYFDLNRHRGLNWYKSFFPLKTSKKRTGEASPYYLFSKTAPRELSKVKPDIKLIVLIRNPIDRAYSQYQMTAKQVNDPNYPRFEEVIAPGNEMEARRNFLSRGLYALHIKNWFECFERGQFLFIKSEDFFADPKEALGELYKWLGVDEIYPRDLKARQVGSYSELSPQIRTALEDYYRAPNRELIGILGDRFRWQGPGA